MMLTYVDDCIIFHKSEGVIDEVIESLQTPKSGDQAKFTTEVEDDYAGFLGTDIHKHYNGTIELKQTGLIK
jgi:hypothetical protein